MRLTLPRTLLLTLALILGQWLTLAHASEHPALSGEKAGCELCLHVHKLGTALPATGTLPVVAADHERPAVVAQPVVRSTLAQHYPIRGPPALSL